MKFVTIWVSDDEAMVELRPSWIACLFGAEVKRVWLEWDENGQRWLGVNTRTPLSHLEYGSAIARVLDFQPIAVPPSATTTRGAA